MELRVIDLKRYLMSKKISVKNCVGKSRHYQFFTMFVRKRRIFLESDDSSSIETIGELGISIE